MKNPIIFYGITDITINKIDNFIERAGAEPILFSTKDEEIKNFKGKPYLGKYEVVSIKEAHERYPDADVWVTYAVANNTARIISGFYKPEKIHFFEADLEYRRGCGYIGHFIDYGGDFISPCCIVGHNPSIRVAGRERERELKTA